MPHATKTNSIRILGIDPGYDRLGLAIIEKPLKGKEVVIFSECFETSSKNDIHSRLLEVGVELSRMLDEFKPDAVAIETLFINNNQKTAMRVAEVRGIAIFESRKRNVSVFEYSPLQIKMAITGDGTSDKTRMIKMVGLLVSFKKNAVLDDEYDAIAVALTHSAIIHSPALLQK